MVIGGGGREAKDLAVLPGLLGGGVGEECEAAGQAGIELSPKLFHIMFKRITG